MLTMRFFRLEIVALFGALLAVCAPSRAAVQEGAATGATQEGSYLLAFRTPAHVSRSQPEVFHQVVDDLQEYLRANRVRVIPDPLRGTILTDDEFPLSTMLNLTREAGATHLLYVIVDRPAAAWVKVTLRCYEASGKAVWEEVAQDKGSLSGKGGLKKTLERMRKKLQPRVGEACLPEQEVSQ